MKNLGGRPTDYSEEMIVKAKEYLDSCKDSFGLQVTVNLPTNYGLARYLNVNRDTLNEWGKKYPAFSVALRNIEEEQAQRLLNNGLAGTYNSTIAKLILSSNHGMKERTDTTTNDKDIPTPIYSGKSGE